MPFLTKISPVLKGEPSSFTLDKSQLIIVPKVALDDFFKDPTNWLRVTVHYQNTYGQKEVLVFDASIESPTASFSVTEKSRSDYQITKIIIRDLDDGKITINRNDLSAEILATLDVSPQAPDGVGPSETNFVTYDIFNAGLALTPQGGVSFINHSNSEEKRTAKSTIPLIGDFDVSFNLGNIDLPIPVQVGLTVFGLSRHATLSEVGDTSSSVYVFIWGQNAIYYQTESSFDWIYNINDLPPNPTDITVRFKRTNGFVETFINDVNKYIGFTDNSTLYAGVTLGDYSDVNPPRPIITTISTPVVPVEPNYVTYSTFSPRLVITPQGGVSLMNSLADGELYSAKSMPLIGNFDISLTIGNVNLQGLSSYNATTISLSRNSNINAVYYNYSNTALYVDIYADEWGADIYQESNIKVNDYSGIRGGLLFPPLDSTELTFRFKRTNGLIETFMNGVKQMMDFTDNGTLYLTATLADYTVEEPPFPVVSTIAYPVAPVVIPPVSPDNFTYADFQSTFGLSLSSTQGIVDNHISLTALSEGDVGNVWRTSEIKYDRNFEISWNFECGGGPGGWYGADGFCVQWVTLPSVGTSGGSAGAVINYNAIHAILFRTFLNNTVARLHRGTELSAEPSSVNFRQNVYYWINYNHMNQTMSVYFNTTDSKPVAPQHIMSNFLFDSADYFFGVGAATGGYTDLHFLKSLRLSF